MKHLVITLLAALALTGCSQKEKAAPQPESGYTEIKVGQTYEDVIDALGDPNIETTSERSRVMIYDAVEIKLQSNVVVEVFDHR